LDDLVEAALKAGKSLEEMKAESVLGKCEAKGQGFVKTAGFTELIFDELQGRRGATEQESRRHH
jgi:hypothetical protein